MIAVVAWNFLVKVLVFSIPSSLSKNIRIITHIAPFIVMLSSTQKKERNPLLPLTHSLPIYIYHLFSPLIGFVFVSNTDPVVASYRQTFF
jgi:hypothetical protein